jgi:MATE family multidrug resistance protein
MHLLASFKSNFSQNFRLAYPVMLSQLGHVAMGITDNIMVGHVGTQSLAAASLANVAFNVLLLFGIGVSYAITPLVAAADGEHNHQQITDTLRHGLVINITTAIILISIVMGAKNLLYHINQPREVVALAVPYLGIITFSILPTLIFQTFRQFAEGLSNTQLAMIIVIGTNVIHVILNYILIYGSGSIPPLGLVGAGWATLFSRIIMAAAIAAYIYYAQRYRLYRAAFRWQQYSRALFKKMLNIGIPAGVQFIFEVAAFDFSAVMMGWLGTNALAAHQVALNLATISYMTTSGLAAAATIRVSHEYGKRNWPQMRAAANTLLITALLFMTAWAIIFILGRYYLPSLYISDDSVIHTAAPLIVIAGLFQLSDGAQVVCAGALRGLQDVRFPSLFIFIAYWVIGLPLGYGLAFRAGYGATGVWIGLSIGLTLTALAMYLRLRFMTHNQSRA